MGVGRQINLDQGEGQITYAKFVDDIRAPCTQLIVTFECNTKLTFDNSSSYYFTYNDMDWVPTSKSETKTTNTWHYDMDCYPKACFDTITQPTPNTQSLATVLGMKLLEGSSSLKIDYPIINKSVGETIQLYRKQSLDINYLDEQIGKSNYIYFDGTSLISNTYEQLAKQKALVFETSIEPIIKQIDDRFFKEYMSARNPEPWNQNDYLYKMLGKSFEVISTTGAYFLCMYTLPFNNYDSDGSYLCARTEYDAFSGVGYTHTFVEVQYV